VQEVLGERQEREALLRRERPQEASAAQVSLAAPEVLRQEQPLEA
jgi:hypothetical protein